MTPPSVNQNILQPKLIVPSRDFDPHDGDLVLAIDDSKCPAPPLLAECSVISKQNAQLFEVHLTKKAQHDLVFHARVAFTINPPSPCGVGLIPRIYEFARGPENRIIYPTARYFVGVTQVVEAVRIEERLKDYLPWFEIHFP